MEKFTHATCYVHQKEYDFAMNPIPLYYKSYEHPSLGITRPFEEIQFQLIQSDYEVCPGIRTIETFGHSPGHQSVEIDTKDGTYIICGDAIFILDNIKEIPEIHYDITPPGRFANIIDAWKSIERIKSRVGDRTDLLLPCHEKQLLERIKTTPILG